MGIFDFLTGNTQQPAPPSAQQAPTPEMTINPPKAGLFGLSNQDRMMLGLAMMANANSDKGIFGVLETMQQMKHQEEANKARQFQQMIDLERLNLSRKGDARDERRLGIEEGRYKTEQQKMQQEAEIRQEAVDTIKAYQSDQMSFDEYNERMAAIQAKMGNLSGATEMLSPSYQGMTQGVDAQGNPVFIQQDKFGNVRAVEGFAPKPDKPKTQDIFTQANTLRDEYTTQSKEYINVRNAYGRMQASVVEPSAAGDLSLLFNYIKMLDPGSTVREGEFATAQNSGSAYQVAGALYNKILSGQRLTDSQRKDFADRANKLYGQQEKSYLETKKKYTKLAEKFNIDPEYVIVDFQPEAMQAAVPGTSSPTSQNDPLGIR